MIEKIFFYSTASNYFLLHAKFSFLHFTPPFIQATAAKNITSLIAILDPCTHEKNYYPLYEKSGAHVCLQSIFLSKPLIRKVITIYQ